MHILQNSLKNYKFERIIVFDVVTLHFKLKCIVKRGTINLMTIQELEKELKLNNLEGIYLLYGEETFLLESSLKKMKKIFGEQILRYKLHTNR